jgi:hypothetical protein
MKEGEKRIVSRFLSLHKPSFFIPNICSQCLLYCLLFVLGYGWKCLDFDILVLDMYLDYKAPVISILVAMNIMLIPTPSCLFLPQNGVCSKRVFWVFCGIGRKLRTQSQDEFHLVVIGH